MLGGSATPTAWKATDIACHRCAQDEALALLFGFDFLNAIEVHEQGAPLGFQSRRGQMVFQPLAQDEREEGAKYVAADGGVLLMINRPGVENRFCRSEDVLDLEQLSIPQHDGERAQGGIGAQDIEAVIKGVFRHRLLSISKCFSSGVLR